MDDLNNIGKKDANRITRRVALKNLSVGAAGALIVPSWGANKTLVSTQPTLNVYSDYSWLRGFNIIPSWGSRIEEAWWYYDPVKMRQEAALAREVHANCIRLWIEFTAWMADPAKVTERFLDAVRAIDEAGMKTMPCIFNRWHDAQYDYGGLYLENIDKNWDPMMKYVREIVTPLADDPRILIWDLCNEPQTSRNRKIKPESEYGKLELKFFEEVAKTVRNAGAKQPITIGTMRAPQIELFAHIPDVLCAHPYIREESELKEVIQVLKAVEEKYNKPMLVNECMAGGLDDYARANLVKCHSELLEAAGFGWMAWALKEGKAISTRKDRMDGNGINGEGFHPFFTKEGKLRNGLNFLKIKPKKPAPWE